MDEVMLIGDAFLCGIDDWMDIWGDPLLSGTIFMLSYAVTALLVFRAARNHEGRERWYWRICGFIFFFQVANTPLDLHALVWTTGRCLAHAQGWYENRREIQVLFLVGLALLLASILLLALFVFLRNMLGNALLTAGVSIVVGFTLVKGINYHGFEQFYGADAGPFHVADFIEYSGIAIALLAALLRLRRNSAGQG
jgi:hypothetical protein